MEHGAVLMEAFFACEMRAFMRVKLCICNENTGEN